MSATEQDVLDLLNELRTRIDIKEATPNTRNDADTVIANDDFTLTKVDNGDGTFSIVRT